MHEHPGRLSAEEEQELQKLLDAVWSRVVPPPNVAVLCEGSIAEGFGNTTSDFDVSFVVDSDEPMPIMRTVLYPGGRRVEIYYRPVPRLRSLAATVNARSAASAEDVRSLSEESVEAYQRFCNAAVLRDQPFLAEVRALFDAAHIGRIMAARSALRARTLALKALALVDLEQNQLAAGAGLQALLWAVKAHVAGRGESYHSIKWIEEQMVRSSMDPSLRRRVRALVEEPDPGRDARGYVAAVVETMTALGVPNADAAAPETRVEARDCERYEIGGRAYRLDGERDLYALSDAAAEGWSQCESAPRLRDVLADAPDPRRRVLAGVLWELHLKGLASIFLGGTERWQRDGSAPPSRWPALFVGPTGALFDDPLDDPSAEHVRLVPLPARDLVASGGAILWNHLVVENALEDANGALEAGQWGMVETALRIRVRTVCMIALLAHGVSPNPGWEEAVARAASLPGLEAYMRRAAALERLVVRNRSEAERAIAEVQEFVDAAPAALRADFMTGVTSSQEVYDRMLKIGAQWIGLAARTQATLPIPEAAELMTFFAQGRQPRVRDERRAAT